MINYRLTYTFYSLNIPGESQRLPLPVIVFVRPDTLRVWVLIWLRKTFIYFFTSVLPWACGKENSGVSVSPRRSENKQKGSETKRDVLDQTLAAGDDSDFYPRRDASSGRGEFNCFYIFPQETHRRVLRGKHTGRLPNSHLPPYTVLCSSGMQLSTQLSWPTTTSYLYLL